MIEHELHVRGKIGQRKYLVDLMWECAEIEGQASAFQPLDILAEKNTLGNVIRYDMQHTTKAFDERIAKLQFEIFRKSRLFRAARGDCTLDETARSSGNLLNVVRFSLNGIGCHIHFHMQCCCNAAALSLLPIGLEQKVVVERRDIPSHG